MVVSSSIFVMCAIVALVVNIVLMYHFIVMCQSVRRIADKLAPEEDDEGGQTSVTTRIVAIGLILLLIVGIVAMSKI